MLEGVVGTVNRVLAARVHISGSQGRSPAESGVPALSSVRDTKTVIRALPAGMTIKGSIQCVVLCHEPTFHANVVESSLEIGRA
jgi:hypothetical protein